MTNQSAPRSTPVPSTPDLYITPVEPIPRITLTITEAAQAIGVSERHFHTHVKPQLALVPSGRRVLVPVAELWRWAEENSVRF
jgi:hypothetical protein